MTPESRSGHTALWMLGALTVFGTVGPWFITWGLLWLTIAIALAIAGLLAMVGLRSQPTDQDVGSQK